MKRFLLLLLIAAGCSGPVAAPADAGRRAQAAKIASAILEYEDGLPRERNPTCIEPRTDGVAFDGHRESLRLARSARPANAGEAAFNARSIESYSNPWFDWRLPRTLTAYAFDSGVPLAETERLLLSRAAAAIVHAPPQPSPLRRLKRTGNPWSLRSWLWYRLCPASVSLTAPAFHGDLAFVESSHVCGGLCGYGSVYALRRKQEEWRIVAVAMTWVS